MFVYLPKQVESKISQITKHNRRGNIQKLINQINNQMLTNTTQMSSLNENMAA